MTGGQEIEAGMSVPAMTRMLEAEGVKKIIITTNETDKYPSGSRWSAISEVWHRDKIIEDAGGLTKSARRDGFNP